MNKDQYDTLQSDTSTDIAVIGASQLGNRVPRTLIYGYTLDRHDFHVYLGTDDAIHLLVCTGISKDPETGAERHLILDQAGPEGRPIQDNREYLPCKRAYPESCDFEFCRLLRTVGLHPSYTTFTEGADERRHEQHGLFAGETHYSANLLKGKSLNSEISAHPLYEERSGSDHKLAARLIMQAANDLGIPANTYGGSAIVAEYGVDAVLAKATEYLEALEDVDVQSSHFVSDLVNEAFGYGHYIHAGQVDLVNGGISFMAEYEGHPFKENAKFKRYVGTSFDGAEAIIGDYEGMPFMAAQLSATTVMFRLQQFGDKQRSLAQWLRMCNLQPVGKKKAAKPAATA